MEQTKYNPSIDEIEAAAANMEDNEKTLSSDRMRENYSRNVERHADQINAYLAEGLVRDLPENYRSKYLDLFNRHYSELQGQPIDAKCKFTLVLPAHREEKVILATLQSLEEQTVDASVFEVIVVNNYLEGNKPKTIEYDEQGIKIGEHEDRTTEIVKEFAKKSKIKVMIVEQAFPSQVKGVGIAAKLGMDLALRRQKENPQVIGYYGADTVFDKQWIRGVLDGFSEPEVDGVRGVAKTGELDKRVEDENGLHILSSAEAEEIMSLEKARYLYNQQVHKLSNFLDDAKEAKKTQTAGLPALTAGIYAKVGGMKGYALEKTNAEERAVTSGEDWDIAQKVASNGKIFWNSNMQTKILPRIEAPRAKGGSFTEGLVSIYRAYRYGEGDVLDKNKNLIVIDPEQIIVGKQLENAFKKMLMGLADQNTEKLILQFIDQSDLDDIKQQMREYSGKDWEAFTKQIPQKTANSVKQRLNDKFPKMPIVEAEKKLKIIKEQITLF